MLEHALDRRKSGPARNEDHRLVRLLAQVERAVRPLDAQDLLRRKIAKQMLGERAARHVPDVQLEGPIVMGRGREREAATRPVLHQDVDVLSRKELQPLARRQLQRNDRDIRRREVDALDAHRHPPDLDVVGATHFATLKDQVARRPRDARQDVPLLLLDFGQRRRLERCVADLALDEAALARPARAVATAVRQDQVRAERCGEDRLVDVACKARIAGLASDRSGIAELYGNFESHGKAESAVDRLRRRRIAHRAPAVSNVPLIWPYPEPRPALVASRRGHHADRR